MANVTGTALKTFSYKGKTYNDGDEVKMDANHAARHEKYVKFNREAEKKVEAAEEKKTKSDAVTMKAAPKTK